jgi:hypothetical protein
MSFVQEIRVLLVKPRVGTRRSRAESICQTNICPPLAAGEAKRAKEEAKKKK